MLHGREYFQGLRSCSSHITDSSYIFAESVNNSEKNLQCLLRVVKHSRMDVIIHRMDVIIMS